MDGSLRQRKKKHDFESSTFQNNFLKENHQRQNWENLLTNHYRGLDAAFQYDLWCPAAKNISITHAAAAPSNLDAAITIRSPDTELQNTKELRATAWEIAAPKPDGSRHQTKKNHPCSHYHAICIQNIKGELSRLRSKRSKPHPAHTRGTFHRRLQPLDTEKHKVLCSGFLPKTNPMQQSRSCHYNAFCSNTYPSMQPLQCDWHPHVAEHQGRTDYARNDPTAPAAHTRYDSSPAVATLHGKTEGFVLRLPPQNKPHPTVMQPPLQCVLQQHDHDHLTPQGVKNVTYIFGVPLCRVLGPWLYTTYIHIYVGCLIRSHKVNARILHF